MKIALPVLIVVLGLNAAAFAESRYGSWRRTEPGGQTVLLRELKDLIREAEQARAADPRFLRDLRALVRRHDNPWPIALVFDDFADGDYTANPAWTVGSGIFRVRRSGGLHTSAGDRSQQQGQGDGARENRRERDKDIAARIIGQLLLGGQGGQAQQSSRPVPSGPAEIFLARPISNSFSIQALLAGRGEDGFELGVYQGQKRSVGYRLIYTPRDGLLLMRITQRGASVIEQVKPKANLLDGRDRVLIWRRSEDGGMTVSVDNAKLLQTSDRGFRDPFDGFHLFNRGGELTLYSLTIDGTGK